MKRLFIIIPLLLAGCGGNTVTDDVFNGIHNDINSLTQQLPNECKTDAIKAQINAITDQVTLAQKSCNKDISDCRADTFRWKLRFYGLAGVILALVLFRIYGRKVF